MRRLLRRKQISATLLSVMAGAFLAAPKANALVESFSFTTQCYGVICTAAWSKVSGYVDSIINRGALVTGYAFGPGYFSQSQLVQVGWFPASVSAIAFSPVCTKQLASMVITYSSWLLDWKVTSGSTHLRVTALQSPADGCRVAEPAIDC
jgi:hypothetical protein